MASLTDFLRRLRAGPKTRFGTIERIAAVYSPQLDNERDLLISLPSRYGAWGTRYPVIYMHDGQNLFDPAMSFSGSWNVDIAMAELSLGGLEAIVVGIPNMGHQRLSEYSPFDHAEFGAGRGDLYLEFLTKTVKPLIDKRYMTLADRAHTGIVGSSMGGLISLYAFFRHPEVFGFAGVLSPSLWLTEDATFDFIEHAPFFPGRLYLDVGTREGERHVLSAQRMRDLLEAKGYRQGQDLLWVEDERGHHHEAAWARRFQKALPFLVPPAEPARSDRIARLIAKTARAVNIIESHEQQALRYQRWRSKGE